MAISVAVEPEDEPELALESFAAAPTLFEDEEPVWATADVDPLADLVIQPAEQPVETTIGAGDATPDGGSPTLPPMDVSFADLPTGEIPVIRATSGPVVVPDLDDPIGDPLVRPAARANDLRIVED
jgi:hypothetical protein